MPHKVVSKAPHWGALPRQGPAERLDLASKNQAALLREESDGDLRRLARLDPRHAVELLAQAQPKSDRASLL
eukprot:1132374-Pyramimonas_sp.AAC.1